MPEEQFYVFEVRLGAYASNPDEAWERVVEGFIQDPGPFPDEYEIEDERGDVIECICPAQVKA